MKNIAVSIKKFSVDHWMILILLLVLLFSNTIKYFIGKELGAILPDMICFVMLLAIIKNKYFLKYTRYDVWIFILFIYTFFNQIYSVLTYSSILESLVYYKIFYRGIILYYFVRVMFEKNINNVFYIRKILLIFSIVLFSDVIVEFILFNIFNVNLLSLPWASYYNSVANLEYFGNTELNNIRVPTLYGMPHNASLLAASLAFIWMYFYKTYKLKIDLYMVYFALLTALLANSKLQILILIICFIFLIIKTFSKVKLFILSISLITISIIFFDIIFAPLFDFKNLGSEMEFFIAWDFFLEGDYDALLKYSFIDLIPLNQYEFYHLYNISIYLLGVGMMDSSFSGVLYKIMRIESSLWLEVLPQLGLIFLYIYYKSLVYLKPKKFEINLYILWLSLFPFYFSILHFWLLSRSGIMEMFVIIYAVVVVSLENRKALS